MTPPRLFREDKCTRCGECLTRCQYMNLSRAAAIRERERLIAGEPSVVHKKCISCYACNVFCPEEAHPYELILETWEKRYERRGLPVRALYLLPYQEPNYRTEMESHMTGREQELLHRWRAAPLEGEVLYPGCNLLTLPSLADLPVFASLPVAGDWNLCCGEPFYRAGMFSVVEEIAAGLSRYYADKKITKMVFVCPACLNMFRNILPRQFGARFDFECEYILTWLVRKMEAGEIVFSRPLNRTVAIHDSCHGRVLGAEVMEQNRQFLRQLGLRVINLKRHHEEGLCCGIAAGLNRFMPQDIVAVSWRELREAKAAGAPELAIYCTGCYLMLHIANQVVWSGQRLVHTLEYLAEVLGEPAPRLVIPRTRRMLANISARTLPLLFSSRWVHLPPLPVGLPGKK